MDDELESGSSASSGGGLERATLDMCVIDEETFGLWVAALRARSARTYLHIYISTHIRLYRNTRL